MAPWHPPSAISYLRPNPPLSLEGGCAADPTSTVVTEQAEGAELKTAVCFNNNNSKS